MAAKGSAAQEGCAGWFGLEQIVLEYLFRPGLGTVVVLVLKRVEADGERDRGCRRAKVTRGVVSSEI